MKEDELIETISDLKGWGTTLDKNIIEERIVKAVRELYAAIAAQDAEIARLKAIIREVEWVWDSEGYNPLTDTEMPESYECTFCHAKSPEDNHAESCPFYKWEGDD